MSDQELRAELIEMRKALAELAASMAEMAKTTVRYEEKEIASRERMDRIESNQKEQGAKISVLHDAVLINTQAVKRIAWVSTVAVGAFLSGSMGFVFWLVKLLIEKGVTV